MGLIRTHLDLVRAKKWGPLVAFDTETDGLNGSLVVASFCDKERPYTSEPWALDMQHLPKPCVLAGHNLAYDLRVLMREGIRPPEQCVLWDTQVAEHLLDEINPFWDLDALAKKYLNRELKSWEEVKDSPVDLRVYAQEDARAVYDIVPIQWTELKTQGLLDYALRIEMPLVSMIAGMEHRGIRLDVAEVRKRLREAKVDAATFKAELMDALKSFDSSCQREGCEGGKYHYKRGNKVVDCIECGGTGQNPVLLTSGDVLADIIHGHFGLPVLEKTKTGKPKLDKDILPQLRDKAERDGKKAGADFVSSLLRYRSKEKMISTYYGPWLNAGTPRLYPSFNGTGTVSGRWSSSKPNFQNIPPEGRPCMIPDEGMAFVSVDYTQIELYLLGVKAGERSIIEAYERGDDMHENTAKAIYGDDYVRDKIADNGQTHRHNGKTINFALIYGLGLKSLAVKLNTDEAEAERVLNIVLSNFPRLPAYKVEVIEKVTRIGYAATLLGRRRRLPDLRLSSLNWKNRYKIGRAERQAVNHTIQGSAGDLLKCAMLATNLKIPEAVPTLQIHDEVIYQVPAGKADELAVQIKECFESACNLVHPKAEAIVMRERWEAK